MNVFFKKVRGRLLMFTHEVLPKYFIATPFLSSFYYLVFSDKFRREQHAMLMGKVKHLKELKGNKSNIFTLIRNTHRIEKGLLMRPKREVFAIDYIEETVDAFAYTWDSDKVNHDNQSKWFLDVLTEYFETSGENPKIVKCQKKFEAAQKQNEISFSENGAIKAVPYFRNKVDKPKITYEEFYNLTRFRRSVRWFLDKKVPRDLIDKAILAANQSPSACNRQPFTYRIIDDPDLKSEVASLPMGIKGYADNVPVIIVVVGNLAAYFDERDRHLIYIDASLANMSLMLALETLGLSSCSINWPDIESLEIKMEKVLDLDKHQRPVMCLALGYPDPDGKVAYSEKRNLEIIRKYN